MRVDGDAGFIEYDLGDITEVYNLFASLDIDFENVSKSAIKENIVLVGNLIKVQGKYVTKMELKDSNGNIVTDYDVAIKNFEFIEIVQDMAMAIFELISGANKKKRSSKK